MMGEPPLSDREEMIRRYKVILKDVVDRRPSGIRQKIAAGIARNKSFVSQITNPNYKTPVPERHLEYIFEVAHFTPEEKARFLECYHQAHPRTRAGVRSGPMHTAEDQRTLRVDLPRLASPAEEARVDQLVRDFARRVSEIVKSRP